jgi:hypothetical protein
VARTGVPLRDVERIAAAVGDEPLPERAPLRAADVERMRERLAGLPPPLADLDHVPATAETVLERVRFLHEHYELERCRVLLLGDHDGTSLAFDELGAAPRELAVVDVDQRLLEHHGAENPRSDSRSEAAGRPRSGPPRCVAFFADLRVGLPAPLRGRFDLVLTDPPYSPAGVGLFAARGVEALASDRPARLLVAYGYPAGSPALGLKVQAELAKLELVFEAVLPGFNAYDGAQAIGSRAALYVLRPTKRSRRIATRRGARHALYTRGRQAVESQAEAPDVRELEGDPDGLYFGGDWRPLAELLEAPQEAPAVYVNLAPDLVYSLYQAAAAVSAPRALIVAHNRTEGLRTAEEQARLRAVAAPREVVRIARSWRDSPYTLVELAGPAGRDEARVYRAAATSISIASAASGAPQSSSEAGVATP